MTTDYVFSDKQHSRREVHMLKLKKFLILAGGSLIVGTTAFAADEGGFVEGSVGATSFSSSNFSGFNVGKTSTSWGLTGGYMFNNNVGLEAGYLDLGNVSGTTASLAAGTYTANGKTLVVTTATSASLKGNSTGWLLGVRGNLPLNNQFR
jgi:hypothetical protein